MPIYAYRCESCGHAQDILRKMSDPPLTVCPVCGAEAFRKQVTAAGFQLKGSGWYVTDFRNPPAAAPKAEKKEAPGESSVDAKPSGDAPAKPDGASDKPAADTSAKAAPPAAPPPAPAPSNG